MTVPEPPQVGHSREEGWWWWFEKRKKDVSKEVSGRRRLKTKRGGKKEREGQIEFADPRASDARVDPSSSQSRL